MADYNKYFDSLPNVSLEYLFLIFTIATLTIIPISVEATVKENTFDCNEIHVKTLRDNGKFACVKETTAQKLDWAIIEEKIIFLPRERYHVSMDYKPWTILISPKFIEVGEPFTVDYIFAWFKFDERGKNPFNFDPPTSTQILLVQKNPEITFVNSTQKPSNVLIHEEPKDWNNSTVYLFDIPYDTSKIFKHTLTFIVNEQVQNDSAPELGLMLGHAKLVLQFDYEHDNKITISEMHD